jgi:two-component system cell cycle response regulator DivK
MRLFRDILEAHGYHVSEATNGMEGWRSACDHRPDVIVMDIQLPDVSGLEVTRWLKDDENLKPIPIIAVSAFAVAGDDKKFLKSGCDAFVPKPISIPKFLQTIERLFAEGTNGAERDFGTTRSLK